MKATTAQMSATLAQKAIALLMALVLCMGLTPHAAWAEETGETGGSSAPQAVEQPTVTLTIVNGFGYSGPNVLVNKAYSFTEGQTLAEFAGIGYATGLFGSAQPDEQVAQQQAQEQSASASSTSVKQSTSGQPDNSQDGGDKASSAEDGKAKDENSSTDSSQEQSEGSSSEQASQSDASSGGGLGHLAQQRLAHPKTLAPLLPLVLRLHIRSLNPNPPLRRRPARFPFTSVSIARARKAMAWEAFLMAPRSCSLKAPRCTTPCARPALPFPVRPIM